MFRPLLILAMLSGLVIGPCALSCGLAALSCQSCCDTVDANDEPCPVEPQPLCECDDSDASALLSSMTILPASAPAQELRRYLAAALATWECLGYVPVLARAPPGLAALRSVVLLI